MTRKPSLKTTISISLALASALALAGPASAGGLLGSAGGLAAGATGGIGGAVGLGAGAGPLGGIGGGLTGSGHGLVGATLGGNGLQPGFASGVSRPLTSGGAGGLGGGRAWGSFEDAKGALSGKTGLATDRVKQVAGKSVGLAKGGLGSGLGTPGGTAQTAKAGGLQSVTDGFVLSRSFELPAKAPVQGRAHASGKASSSASGSASARGARVASNVGGSAQVQAAP
ncbi:MAG: hypothetical protein JWO64_616 [Hyphomicrobiales bacterium]|jgi:hypothetical protein|nr:hypothetical protein [Hyphomicrobiales bacterium]